MDDMIDFPNLGIETEAQKTERRIVQDLQQFIDDQQGLEDELTLLDSGDIINEGIAELDRQCTHHQDIVSVHGTVLMSHYDTLEEVNKVEAVLLTGQKLKSHGFTVQRVQNPDGTPGRALVGHLFESFQEDVPNSESGLIQTTTQYFAYAPYGQVSIEAHMTKEESVQRLWEYIPEVMEEIDEVLLNAKSQLGALTGLRKLSYKTADVPNNILEELIQYVNSTVAPEKIGALTAKINGVFSIDFAENSQAVVPLDINKPSGGSAIMMGSPRYLFLSQYASYIDGQTCESKDMYWSLGLAIHRTQPEHASLEGQVIDVMVGDLRDPILVDVTEERAA